MKLEMPKLYTKPVPLDDENEMNVDASGRMKCECDAKVERRQVEEGIRGKADNGQAGFEGGEARETEGVYCLFVMKCKMK